MCTQFFICIGSILLYASDLLIRSKLYISISNIIINNSRYILFGYSLYFVD